MHLGTGLSDDDPPGFVGGGSSTRQCGLAFGQGSAVRKGEECASVRTVIVAQISISGRKRDKRSFVIRLQGCVNE
jgi:hypothetical protein